MNLPGRVLDHGGLLDALESVHRQSVTLTRGFGIVLFSIDRFRLINSRFGPAQADEVLRRVGTAARQALPRKAAVGRWGGDEFLCLLADADDEMSYRTAEQLRLRIANLVIPLGDGVATVTASFGVACYPASGRDIGALLSAAGAALHEAKRRGRNRVVAAGGVQSPVHRVAGLVETALREERVMPAYQPIFDLDSGRLVAEEALARIITTDERVLEAHEFIDAAAELQLTHRIDRVIIASALERCAANSARGTQLPIFVNVSGSLLHHPELIREFLGRALAQREAAGERRADTIVIEITERELLGDLPDAKRLLMPFVDLGLKLALDDFGSGYSSFQYLADLPVSFLKIDGRLILRLQESRIRAIVRGIHNTAKELGLTTLAEFVEHERQANILREIGVDWAQGYYFSRAVLDEKEAGARRRMSVNWAEGYYYRRPSLKS